VRWLVTSRRPLELDGEVVLSLEPLDGEAALQLFLHRAEAARPGFGALLSDADRDRLARFVVEGLDGLPLAIELAAARARILGVEQLVAKLGQRFRLLRDPDRPGTALQDAIERSWELMEPGDRLALSRLTVCRGGFDLAAAEAILEEQDGDWAVDILERLHRDAMLQLRPRDAVRYDLLESIRDFAAARLEDPDVPVARHRAHFVERGRRLRRVVRAGGGRAALLELAGERLNLDTALEAALPVDAEAAGELALTLSLLHTLQGPPGRRLEVLDLALEAGAPQRVELQRLRADALRVVGRHPEAEVLIDALVGEAPAALRPRVLATWLAVHLHGHDDVHGVLRRAPEVLAATRASGDRWFEGITQLNLALAHHGLRQVDEAMAAHNAALAIFEELGDPFTAVAVRANMCTVYRHRGDFGLAARLAERTIVEAGELGMLALEVQIRFSLAMFRMLEGDMSGAMADIDAYARFAARQGDPASARRTHVIRAEWALNDRDYVGTLAHVDTGLLERDLQRTDDVMSMLAMAGMARRGLGQPELAVELLAEALTGGCASGMSEGLLGLFAADLAAARADVGDVGGAQEALADVASPHMRRIAEAHVARACGEPEPDLTEVREHAAGPGGIQPTPSLRLYDFR
jgi:tetratricopeptide (TPR) repeat protein